MHIVIAYESKYGNSKVCVDYLEKILRAQGNNTDQFSIRTLNPHKLPDADLYIFCTPTQLGGTPWTMRRFLKNLNLSSELAKYSLITTCRDERTKCLDKMSELLEEQGLTKLTDGLKIRLNGYSGPLEDNYEEKIKHFALELLKRK